MKRQIQLFLLSIVSLLMMVACNMGNNAIHDSNVELSAKAYPTKDKYYGTEIELFGNSFAALDGASKGMHQTVNGHNKFGNYFGNDIPILVTMRNDNRDWKLNIKRIGGFEEGNHNLDESFIEFINPNEEIGCLKEGFIKKYETCYVYIKVHFKLGNIVEKYDWRSFGTHNYFIYDDVRQIALSLPVTMSNVQTVQSIRPIMFFESQYFTNAVKEKQNQYQILRIQNISYNESKILEIKPNGIKLRNNRSDLFVLQHRHGNGIDDIYGSYPECATPEDISSENKKVSSLKRAEECLLIYKTPEVVDNATDNTDFLDIETNATAAPNSSPQIIRILGQDPITPELMLTANYKSENAKESEIKWQKSNIPSGDFNQTLYGGGKWVAASNGSGLYYSDDGKTWAKSDMESGNFSSIAFGNNVWITGDDSSMTLYSSKDGRNWNNKFSCFGDVVDYRTEPYKIGNKFDAIYYYKNKWRAIVNKKPFYSLGGLAFRSIDGESWDRQNFGFLKPNMFINGNYLAYMKDAFYLIPIDKSWHDLVNHDSNWINVPEFKKSYINSIYANGTLVVAIGNNNDVYYSSDGSNYIKSNAIGDFSRIYYINNTWYITGVGGLYHSTDGKKWVSSGINDNFNFVYNDNSVWLAGSVSGLYTSKDGIAWTKVNDITVNVKAAFYHDGVWVLSTDNGLWYGASFYPQVPGALSKFTISY